MIYHIFFNQYLTGKIKPNIKLIFFITDNQTIVNKQLY